MIDGGTTKVYTHYCTVRAQAKHIRIIDHVCLAMRLDHPSRLSLTTCSHDPCSIHSHLDSDSLLLLCNGHHHHVPQGGMFEGHPQRYAELAWTLFRIAFWMGACRPAFAAFRGLE